MIVKSLQAPEKKRDKHINWPRVVVSLIGVIAVSFGLAYLLQWLGAQFHLPLDEVGWLAYLSVFGATLVSSLTIIVPAPPIAISMMVAAATTWNPVIVALAASIGGTLGELSGYYAGYLGKKIAIAEHMAGHNSIADWMHRYGLWAIFFLAFQPVIPFDIGGLIAGAARMPLWRFLPALWAGKLSKYIILCYSGIGLFHILPFLSQ